MRLEDLTPADRKRVLAALNERPAPRVRAGRQGDRGGRWECSACGVQPKSWAAAERHADELGHHRIVVLL